MNKFQVACLVRNGYDAGSLIEDLANGFTEFLEQMGWNRNVSEIQLELLREVYNPVIVKLFEARNELRKKS